VQFRFQFKLKPKILDKKGKNEDSESYEMRKFRALSVAGIVLAAAIRFWQRRITSGLRDRHFA
jgi:hypothetical protein